MLPGVFKATLGPNADGSHFSIKMKDLLKKNEG